MQIWCYASAKAIFGAYQDFQSTDWKERGCVKSRCYRLDSKTILENEKLVITKIRKKVVVEIQETELGENEHVESVKKGWKIALTRNKSKQKNCSRKIGN